MSAKKIAAYKVLQALGVLTNSPSGTMPSTSTMIQIRKNFFTSVPTYKIK